ncbi:MAG TPA: malto-oligosyltrehalose trehalohydrolase [Rhizobacter sp.]|nr:malto-oligosyltrehalose trehalohydrolase [Rhizobacter sp.]
MPFGAELLEEGGTAFSLWAPKLAQVELDLRSTGRVTRHPMHRSPAGWHELRVAEAGPGTRYKFAVGKGLVVPDPASRYNPEDIHGASEVVDPLAYAWRDVAWRGRPWHEAVVYELHIGCFTPEGTFVAAAQRLGELAALGITAIELMPLADFPGKRGWGYDGVLLFAPKAGYGTPDALKALIDAAHALGMMVLLDVVYNHFGPEGNYLHAYCPQFFNPRHHTPWGAAINFDGDDSATVRDFYRHNALYWVEEYHFDGLRLDAVHAICDDSPTFIVNEIAQALRNGPGRERHVHLVLENERNQASLLARAADGSPRVATAQWNDDLHHAAHVLLSGETDGYYADYAAAPLQHLGRALAQGFAYQGEPSAWRGSRPHGEPSGHLPSVAFVSFLQNHDQIGNRAMGERIDALTRGPAEMALRRLAAVYACLLLSPQIPMLFMGEEFAASSPFLYFCDFGPELAQAVANGRRAEFARFAAFRDEAARACIADPNAVSSFEASQLRWTEREASPHRERLALLKGLLALRQRHLVPLLPAQRNGGSFRVEGGLLSLEWTLGRGVRWQLQANLGDSLIEGVAAADGEVIYLSPVERRADGAMNLEPASVRVTRCAAPAKDG